jgi:hypothetical protein
MIGGEREDSLEGTQGNMVRRNDLRLLTPSGRIEGEK